MHKVTGDFLCYLSVGVIYYTTPHSHLYIINSLFCLLASVSRPGAVPSVPKTRTWSCQNGRTSRIHRQARNNVNLYATTVCRLWCVAKKTFWILQSQLRRKKSKQNPPVILNIKKYNLLLHPNDLKNICLSKFQ